MPQPPPQRQGSRLLGLVLVLFCVAVVAFATLETFTQKLLSAQAQGSPAPSHLHALLPVLNGYLRLRYAVLANLAAVLFWTILGLGAALLCLAALKRVAAAHNRWRASMSGMAFRGERYDLKEIRIPPDQVLDRVRQNPAPHDQVLLGLDDGGRPVWLTDRARSMHVHVLGQTGSGKTKSVIEPLLLQDIWRGRGVLFVDGKGSQENEERLLSFAGACDRLSDTRLFTLNPYRQTHTYNPVHLAAGADPQAVAERVFSSFAEDMDVPYYRDQSRMLFVSLVRACASTGKRFILRDLAAAIVSPEARGILLEQTSDRPARRAVESQLHQLGDKVGQTFTGLLAAVQRYDHPAVNAYAPDIVLEDDIDAGRILGFFLPTNYYKQLARYIGVSVFQHVQQVGALRQLDRARSQTPLYVYADEFYSFAYEGFTDAVNKLRDASISILLSHQTFSDLEKVSPAYAKGIWDNTRNKVCLFQNDFEICERLAKGLGTMKGEELTVRHAVDGWLNSVSMFEASKKEVDQYRCHPNRIKHLQCGQAYLAQDSFFVGVNLQQLPELPPGVLPSRPAKRSDDGIRLHELLLEEPKAKMKGPR